MEIRFSHNFKKRYKKIPLKISRQFDERLLLLEKDIHNLLLSIHPLEGKRLGQWSMNVTGDWRAICNANLV